jgi:transposase
MPKPAKTTAPISVIGIDIGKNVFHLIGLDKRGAVVFKAKLSRGQLMARLANLAPCLIGMEACVGAHNLSRRLIVLGHDARLMPAKYVKAFLKGNKNIRSDDRRIRNTGEQRINGVKDHAPRAYTLYCVSEPYE